MTNIVIVVIAYVLTAVHYVGRDMRADAVGQPAYAREGGFALLKGGLFWLPYTIASMARQGIDNRSTSSIILFFGMVIGMTFGTAQT